MYQYIANYPHWVPNRFDNAFSDQLEQKILPKLRGLSSDKDGAAEETLDAIGDIIGGVNDKQLEEAYDRARQRPVFDFRGVNRLSE